MGGKVLKRELESYEKAYQKYLGRVNTYQKQASEYNKQIDYYNASFVTDLNNNKLVYTPQNQLNAVTPENKIVDAKLAKQEPVMTKVKDAFGREIEQMVTPPNPYEPIQSGEGMGRTSSLPKGVITKDVGGGYKAARVYDAPMPDESQQPAQPAAMTMQAPNPTKAALQRMNQPNWSDIERGLIGQVIKGR